MTYEQARVGTHVITLVDWPEVPTRTEGMIDEDYGSGVMVAWDLPGRPLPKGYGDTWDGTKAELRALGILRDGFSKDDLVYLEISPKYAARTLNQAITKHDDLERRIARNDFDFGGTS